jgi:hypothetical protein
MSEVLIATAASPTPIRVVAPKELDAALAGAPALVGQLAAQARFEAKAGQVLVTPELVLVGVDPSGAVHRALPARLPAGDYALVEPVGGAALAWALGSYRFVRYKQK